MAYFINYSNNNLYLLDTVTKKCGVFSNDRFMGFTTWTDKKWEYEVGLIGVVSYGRQASVIVNNKSEIVNCSALDCARQIVKQGNSKYKLVVQSTIDEVHRINGYIFVYVGDPIIAEGVRRRCNF